MNGDDSSIATDVTELIIVWSRDDLAAETAHEPYTCMDIMRLAFGAWGRRD